MPLNPDAEQLIRQNLETISKGQRAPMVTIGKLSKGQVKALNVLRERQNQPALESDEIVFIGRHVYQSRVGKDGYSIDDVVAQIASALQDTSNANSATSIVSSQPRDDGYGNKVRDKAVFECTSRRPKLELNSVVPMGDHQKPATLSEQHKSRPKAASGER